MDEKEWMTDVLQEIQRRLNEQDSSLTMKQGVKLPYGSEAIRYESSGPKFKPIAFETDLLLIEQLDSEIWKPRVVIEGKLRSITTHDAITYSHKARSHKAVHPDLRYGILIGDRRHYPLPGRLFRHGEYFDFMQSWVSAEPSLQEIDSLIAVLIDEVRASKLLEEILYNSRSPTRERFTLLHRQLKLK